MRAQVAQVGAGHDLALHQPGEPLAGRGADAVRLGAVEVRRDAGGVGVARRRRPAARCTGARRCGWRTRPARPRWPRVGPAGVGQVGLHAGGDQPALDPAGEVGGDRVRPQPHRASRRTGRRDGSITTILPVSCGPARRIRSSARMALGLPPRTIGASRASALRVAGPQVPSGGTPTLRWNSRTARSVGRPNRPSTLADLEARGRAAAAGVRPRRRRPCTLPGSG